MEGCYARIAVPGLRKAIERFMQVPDAALELLQTPARASGDLDAHVLSCPHDHAADSDDEPASGQAGSP